MLHVKWAIDDAEWFDGKDRLSKLCLQTTLASAPLNLALNELVEHSRLTIEYIIDEVSPVASFASN